MNDVGYGSQPHMTTFTVSPELAPLLEKMSADMAVPAEALVNQAVFNWARLHGALEAAAGVVAPRAASAGTPVREDDMLATATRRDGVIPRRPIVEQMTDASVPAVPHVVMLIAGNEIALDIARFVIGRDPTCNFAIDSPRLSRQHAVIHTGGMQPEVEDLNSSNGTWFEGQRISRKVIVDGDEIKFGDVAATFEVR